MRKFACMLIIIILAVSLYGCSYEADYSAEETVLSALDIFYKSKDDNGLSNDIFGYDAEAVRKSYMDVITRSFISGYPEFSIKQNTALAEKMVDTMQTLIEYDTSVISEDSALSAISVSIKTTDLDSFKIKYYEIYNERIEKTGYEHGSEEQISIAYNAYTDTISLLSASPEEFIMKECPVSAELKKTYDILKPKWIIKDFDKFLQKITSSFAGA